MKDRWMNIGFEDDDLKPYCEATRTVDEKRIGKLFSILFCIYVKLVILFFSTTNQLIFELYAKC